MNYQIFSYQNDLYQKEKSKHIYKTIYFEKLDSLLEKKLIKEIINYFKILKLNKNSHIFIVGLGKDFHTPDSVGPNTLKHIKVNAYLENLGIKALPKVSSLKPGVLGETGILTEKTIVSITKEIKPNMVILIDSFVSNKIDDLNHTIELNNEGINPGSGLFGINSFINQEILHVPILVIGVTTSLLVNFPNNPNPYLLSTKDIDAFVQEIAKLIGTSINKAIASLK